MVNVAFHTQNIHTYLHSAVLNRHVRACRNPMFGEGEYVCCDGKQREESEARRQKRATHDLLLRQSPAPQKAGARQRSWRWFSLTFAEYAWLRSTATKLYGPALFTCLKEADAWDVLCAALLEWCHSPPSFRRGFFQFRWHSVEILHFHCSVCS